MGSNELANRGLCAAIKDTLNCNNKGMGEHPEDEDFRLGYIKGLQLMAGVQTRGSITSLADDSVREVRTNPPLARTPLSLTDLAIEIYAENKPEEMMRIYSFGMSKEDTIKGLKVATGLEEAKTILENLKSDKSYVNELIEVLSGKINEKQVDKEASEKVYDKIKEACYKNRRTMEAKTTDRTKTSSTSKDSAIKERDEEIRKGELLGLQLALEDPGKMAGIKISGKECQETSSISDYHWALHGVFITQDFMEKILNASFVLGIYNIQASVKTNPDLSGRISDISKIDKNLSKFMGTLYNETVNEKDFLKSVAYRKNLFEKDRGTYDQLFEDKFINKKNEKEIWMDDNSTIMMIAIGEYLTGHGAEIGSEEKKCLTKIKQGFAEKRQKELNRCLLENDRYREKMFEDMEKAKHSKTQKEISASALSFSVANGQAPVKEKGKTRND